MLLQIKFNFTTQFDTKLLPKDYKLSTSSCKRFALQLVYEIVEAEGFDYILTAHHADDNLETF
jgi:tRNA(Ile)-lysidine synthase